MLKLTRPILSKSLFAVFQNIKRLKKFPVAWKHSKITPIFKLGSKKDAESYRPVTLLNICSKVFERFMFKPIAEAFLCIAESSQYGFMPPKSAILRLLFNRSQVYASVTDRNTDILTFLLDFSKAFDTIKHEILLKKLIKLGISEEFFWLIHDYLSCRTQFVKVNSSVSSKMPITSGVPQGSIIGPLLFLIYKSDLPTSIFFTLVLLFVDDLKLTSKNSTTGSDLSHLQEDIKRLQIWSETNLLLFKMKKWGFVNSKLNGQTRYNSPIEFSFSINNCKIPKIVAAKDLGLIIIENLNWSEHIQSRIAKGMKTLFLLKRNTSFLINVKSKSYLYRATKNPTLLYASECWTANISDIKAIESFNKNLCCG